MPESGAVVAFPRPHHRRRFCTINGGSVSGPVCALRALGIQPEHGQRTLAAVFAPVGLDDPPDMTPLSVEKWRCAYKAV